MRANLRYIAAGVAMQIAGGVFRTKSFGAFEVDLKAAELRKHGIRIKLQDQPFQILTFLMEHPGDLVTREEIRQRLWSAHTFVDFDRSLNKAMTKLRSALGDSADSPRYIETIPRHGYRFLAEVRSRYEGQNGYGHTATAAGGLRISGPTLSPANGAADKVPRSRLDLFLGRRLLVFSILFLALLGGGWYLVLQRGPSRLFHFTSAARPSVAVLGFRNLSGDAQNAWLATALSDWLMTELAVGEQLRTIPAEGIVRMKMEIPLPDVESLGKDTLGRIGRNLGTDYVITGSYAPLGNRSEGRIRMDLRLQDAHSGETIGAFSESGNEAGLSDLVARAGEHLRQTLGVRGTTKEEAAEVATSVPMKAEAVKLYSEGLAKLRAFDALSARTLLTEAVAAEPNYAGSHSALANALLQLGYEVQAIAEAKKAFDLSADSLSRADRLLAEARYRQVSRDWNRAIEIYRALFDFFPDNLEYGLDLTEVQVAANKWKDALDTVEILRRLPAPLRDDPRIDLAENDAARSLGDTHRAEAALERAADKAQATGASLLLARARREQAWLFENSGREEQVEARVNDAMRLYVATHDRLGVAAVATLQAIALERQGDYQRARQKYEESLSIYRDSGNKVSLGAEYDNIGDIYLFLGDVRRARKSYEDALSTYREIGDQNGMALAEIGLGDVFSLLGKLDDAQSMYREALETCKQLGSRNRQALALAGLARVRQLEGQLTEAQLEETEAIEILEEVGNKTEAERVRTATAELLLDEGRVADAELIVRKSASALEEKKALRSAALAKLLLVQTLMKRGQIGEAERIAGQVAMAANLGQDQEVKLRSEMVMAQVTGAGTDSASNLRDSMNRLDRVAHAANASSLVGIAFEARLIAAELQMTRGEQEAGRANLIGLENDCNKAGFTVIARRASASLQANQRAGS